MLIVVDRADIRRYRSVCIALRGLTMAMMRNGWGSLAAGTCRTRCRCRRRDLRDLENLLGKRVRRGHEADTDGKNSCQSSLQEGTSAARNHDPTPTLTMT